MFKFDLKCTFLFVSLFILYAAGNKYFELLYQASDSSATAYNYAILSSGSASIQPSSSFTICGSIYVGFFWERKVFYTLRQNGSDTLWFSLYFQKGRDYVSGYKVALTSYENLSYNNVKIPLRPHAWSHACTSVDTSGRVLVVINGVLSHDAAIILPIAQHFENNLVVGAAWYQYGALETYQSGGSVTNVNIFSDQLSLTKMKHITSTGQVTQGDLLTWPEATWTFVGKVQKKEFQGFSQENKFSQLFNLQNEFPAKECLQLCPRLGTGGRVPTLPNLNDSLVLAQVYKTKTFENELIDHYVCIVAPFVDSDQGFVDFYTRKPMPQGLWAPGKPNGKEGQPFTCISTYKDKEGGLFDIFDEHNGWLRCQCDFPEKPILRLRGLCKDSYIDNTFIILFHNRSFIYRGLTNSEIRFFPSLTKPTWMLGVNLEETKAITKAEGVSYALGKRQWTITNDSVNCNEGEPLIHKYTKIHKNAEDIGLFRWKVHM